LPPPWLPKRVAASFNAHVQLHELGINMLKLKKIHILGFKSFCDRTELTVPGTGIAVVVGPNGCGKSNILDGMSWVLGEQSAKTLRGTHMQDVIFAGTRERKALGMAEVTLTMVDPEAYEGPVPVEPEVVVDHDGPSDWDEDEVRRQRASEAEEIIAAEQPGQVIDDETPELPQLVATGEGPQAVVLKIRRRKFQRTPQKGEIVITRRLFRTGESEYLLIFLWEQGWGPTVTPLLGRNRSGNCSAPSRTTGGQSLRKLRGLRASRPGSGWPSCAWKAPSRTWPAWTIFLKKLRGR
jgi:energy-coupling factor transporter ATP-binding protein EcfA2